MVIRSSGAVDVLPVLQSRRGGLCERNQADKQGVIALIAAFIFMAGLTS